MAVADYSATPASNTSISAISIAEGCPAANINNALRQIMADVKTWSVTYSGDTSGLMPKSGGAFTGSVTRSGAGGLLYNAASTQLGGAFYVQTTGTALPSSPTEGTWVATY